jgi:hypothetical protein
MSVYKKEPAAGKKRKTVKNGRAEGPRREFAAGYSTLES